MKKSVFNPSKLSKLSAVARGQKSSNDIRPAITTARAINKFTMNASASALLAVGAGDRIVMFSLPEADNINERFFIAKSAGEIGCKLASAGNTKGTGRPQSFNYAAIWSQMLMQDPKAAPCGVDVLVDKGLMHEVETQENKEGVMCKAILAVKKVEYGLSLVTDEDGEALPLMIDDVLYENVYALVEPKEFACDEEAEAEGEPDTEYEE